MRMYQSCKALASALWATPFQSPQLVALGKILEAGRLAIQELDFHLYDNFEFKFERRGRRRNTIRRSIRI
jgi:hypothetical protein